jgi:hypothetical protein
MLNAKKRRSATACGVVVATEIERLVDRSNRIDVCIQEHTDLGYGRPPGGGMVETRPPPRLDERVVHLNHRLGFLSSSARPVTPQD